MRDQLLPQMVTVPDPAPPYDCHLHGTSCQDTAVWSRCSPQPGPAPVAQLSAAPGAQPSATPAAQPSAAPAAQPSAAPGGGAAEADGGCASALWPRQFAQAITETLAGVRPFRQLIPWTSDRAQAEIRGLGATLRTSGNPRIIRVLTAQPHPGAAEVTVIARFGARTRAIALRFEHVPARPASSGRPGRPAHWRCTAVETA